jgi:CheY-like chemotaxis protein
MDHTASGSILIVDDNDAVRATLARVLESRGYETVAVASGEDAMLQVRGRSFDIALCDIHLPGMNGIDTALAIRASLPSCRVLLMSGDSGSSDLLDNAKREGHQFEVLAKPFDPATLFAAIKTQLISTA